MNDISNITIICSVWNGKTLAKQFNISKAYTGVNVSYDEEGFQNGTTYIVKLRTMTPAGLSVNTSQGIVRVPRMGK